MKAIKNFISILAIVAGIIGLLVLILVMVGFRSFILKSESMEPVYTKGSPCWVNTGVDLDSVEVGDVLVYRSPANTLVLHRLVDKSSFVDASSLPVTMQGDAYSMSQDVTLSSINFIGREAFTILPARRDIRTHSPQQRRLVHRRRLRAPRPSASPANPLTTKKLCMSIPHICPVANNYNIRIGFTIFITKKNAVGWLRGNTATI